MIVDIPRENSQYIRDHLQMVTQLRNQLVSEREGWTYRCIEEFVNVRGTDFKKREMNVREMTKKACFDNSFSIAMSNPDLFYCEGWAMGIIPIHHAWLCDINGIVHDYTWWGERIGTDNYIGVPFTREFIADQYDIHDRPSLFFPDGIRINTDILNGKAEIVKLND